MMYLAAFLILLALFFFLYAASAGSESPLIQKNTERKPERTHKVTFQQTKSSSKPIQRATYQPAELKDRLFNVRYPNRKNSQEQDLKIRKERSLDPGYSFESHKPEPEPEQDPTLYAETVPYAEMVEEEIHIPETPPVSEIELSSPKITTIVSSQPPVREKTPVLQLTGLLFLDYGRKIPFDYRKFKDMDWQEDSFVHFKRVGNVKVLEYDGIVQFHTGKFSHELHLEHLEQIIFYENAFSLIPQNIANPVSLVFSSDTGKFKTLVTERFK